MDQYMDQYMESESAREEIKNKLRQNFDGKIVRKDLTKKIKEGANVPVYVLEFLLGQYSVRMMNLSLKRAYRM